MRIEQLVYYPVKSCRGIALQRAELTAAGVAGDRGLALADGDGRIASQKQAAALARVAVEPRGAQLVFRVDGHGELAVDAGELDQEVGALLLHDRRCAARRVRSVELAPWLERAVGVRAELYRFVETPFFDLRPLHVVTAESVRELARRAGRDVEPERFRPNLVVSGAQPLDEERWTALSIGDVVLEACGPTARCRMVGLDPQSGAYDPRVTQALVSWRRVADEVRFGRYFAPRVLGSVAVGDGVVASA